MSRHSPGTVLSNGIHDSRLFVLADLESGYVAASLLGGVHCAIDRAKFISDVAASTLQVVRSRDISVATASVIIDQWVRATDRSFHYCPASAFAEAKYITVDEWRELTAPKAEYVPAEPFSEMLGRFLDVRHRYMSAFEWRTVRIDHCDERDLIEEYEEAKEAIDSRVAAIEKAIHDHGR